MTPHTTRASKLKCEPRNSDSVTEEQNIRITIVESPPGHRGHHSLPAMIDVDAPSASAEAAVVARARRGAFTVPNVSDLIYCVAAETASSRP